MKAADQALPAPPGATVTIVTRFRVGPGFFQGSPGPHQSCGSHQILTVMVTNVLYMVQHFKAYIVLSCIRPLHYWNSLYVQDRAANAARIERQQFTFNGMQGSPNPPPSTSSAERMAVNVELMNL